MASLNQRSGEIINLKSNSNGTICTYIMVGWYNQGFCTTTTTTKTRPRQVPNEAPTAAAEIEDELACESLGTTFG